VIPACLEYKVGMIPYFPLACGLLTGKYRRNEPAPANARLSGRPIDDESYDEVEKLENLAEKSGRSLLELAIAGLGSMPAVVSVIAGVTSPDQVRANAAAAEWQLSSGELADLRSALDY
jgi:aryl-alcohol dehydrogenase-like predicted oxidoreductase